MNDDRAKQIERDTYYMGIAEAAQHGAKCLGSKVGAVLVVEDRVVSTGYNGTPSGFRNCDEGGCVRCRDRDLEKQGLHEQMSDPDHVSGKGLDRCVCVHAEQNAIITAARLGIRVEGATLYTTLSPCFSCLKEAVQAGVMRVVYGSWYPAHYSPALVRQYHDLASHLAESEVTRFEALGGERPPIVDTAQPDAYEDDDDAPALDVVVVG